MVATRLNPGQCLLNILLNILEPVRACEPGLGDLFKPTAPAYSFGVKLMFVGVVNFGHVQLLSFIVLKNFRSCSNPNFGHIDSVM